MSAPSEFDENYFMRGKETGVSLYENYTWRPELTIPMVRAIVKHCGIETTDRVLDFGCARGYVVKALRMEGIEAFGTDISKWAIDNAPEEVKPFLNCSNLEHDWIIAKDVLEHMPYVQGSINFLMQAAKKGLFVVVPLSKFDNSRYVVKEYEMDVTHVQRLSLLSWVNMFLRPGWRVEAGYRVPGVKDNYKQFEWGNGFITVRRI